MQAPSPLEPLDTFIARFGGALGILFFGGWSAVKLWRVLTEARDKKNPETVLDPAVVVEQFTEAMHAENRTQSAHLDLEITRHFDQLRRDLTTTIERAHERSDKQTADAMQRLLFEMETFVKESILERRGRSH